MHFVQVDARPATVTATLPPEPRNPFGSGGIGQAILANESEEEQVAPRFMQDQPLLAVASSGAARPSPPSPTKELDAEATPLPPSLSAMTLAEGLNAPPPAPVSSPPAPEPSEAPESPPAVAEGPDNPSPPAQDDRDSSATSKDGPEVVVEAKSGKTVSREGIDFKLRGLRTGLSAYFGGAFLAGDTRFGVRIVVDDSGTPLNVEVIQSSGNDAIDRELRTMFYNSWFDAAPNEPFTFTLVLR